MKRFSYSVSNLRRLRQTPLVEIKPITLLVGRNSIGKSTFLRSLPLLDQSLNTDSSAPVLWFGNRVDFGDFETTKCIGCPEDFIGFNFLIPNLEISITADSRRFLPSQNAWYFDDVYYSFGVCDKSGKTQFRFINIRSDRFDIQLSIDLTDGLVTNSAQINGMPLVDLAEGVRIFITESSPFPELILVSEETIDDEPRMYVQDEAKLFRTLIYDALRPVLDGRVQNRTIEIEAFRILRNARLDPEAERKLASGAPNMQLKHIYRNFHTKSHAKLRDRIEKVLAFRNSLSMMKAAANYLSAMFSNVSYVEPVRALSERFYRVQELQVDQLHPSGNNFPIFFTSLAESQKLNFSKWIEKLFDFSVNVKKESGHYQIQVGQIHNMINIADTGFGLSQLLPVLSVIWWSRNSSARRSLRRYTSNSRLVAIEQPEVHLHPAHQAIVADALASILSDASSDNDDGGVSFVIETHSEALINRIGELVESGVLSHHDVQIILFSEDRDSGDDHTRVSTSTFDAKGVLNDWPYGFFSYDSSL